MAEAGRAPRRFAAGGGASEWVVVLEWALGPGEPLGIGSDMLRALLDELADLAPTALCQPDRYAMQVRLRADGPVAALRAALARQEEALRRVAVGGDLVRVELLTPEELDQEWDDFGATPEGRQAIGSLTGQQTDPVVDAEAALDRVTGPQEAQRVLVRVVRQLGGGVVAARAHDEWTLPVEIALGDGEPQVAIAEPWSVARLRLEQALPRLVEKARHVLSRLGPPELMPEGDAGRRTASAGPAPDEARP